VIKSFLTSGWKGQRNPGPDFDTKEYLRSYPDRARERVIPLTHYIRFGRAKGRIPS
jgi:O-antigen biosynthesis protein